MYIFGLRKPETSYTMKKLLIILFLCLAACKTPDEKAKETTLDYLKAHGKQQLANAAENSFHRINKTQYQFTAGYEKGSNMPFYGQGIYLVILDSTLSKVVSCHLGLTD
jgi:hypothetical protein